jgi:hypothetical protein
MPKASVSRSAYTQILPVAPLLNSNRFSVAFLVDFSGRQIEAPVSSFAEIDLWAYVLS